MENKTQRNARLRKMRQKYHLGEYRKNRVKKHSIKHHRRFKMVKKRHYKRGGKLGMGSIWSNLIGIAGVCVYESMVQPKIPLAATTLNLVELGVGVWLSKKSGIIGNTAKALVTINAYKLIKPLIAGQLGGMLSTTPSLFN